MTLDIYPDILPFLQVIQISHISTVLLLAFKEYSDLVEKSEVLYYCDEFTLINSDHSDHFYSPPATKTLPHKTNTIIIF